MLRDGGLEIPRTHRVSVCEARREVDADRLGLLCHVSVSWPHDTPWGIFKRRQFFPLGRKEPPSGPTGHPDEAQQHDHLYERSEYTCECLPAGSSIDADIARAACAGR